MYIRESSATCLRLGAILTNIENGNALGVTKTASTCGHTIENIIERRTDYERQTYRIAARAFGKQLTNGP
jgi:hypothetical protein